MYGQPDGFWLVKLILFNSNLLHNAVVLAQTGNICVRRVDDVVAVEPLRLPFSHVVEGNEGHLFIVLVGGEPNLQRNDRVRTKHPFQYC